MTILVSSAARLLIQAAQTVASHDTVIMRQVPPVRTWFEQVVFVASGLSTLLVLILIGGLVALMFGIWRTVRRAHEALDRRIELRIDPGAVASRIHTVPSPARQPDGVQSVQAV